MDDQDQTLGDERGEDDIGPYVVVDGQKLHMAVVDRGLIPPWHGLSLKRWWRNSRLNPGRAIIPPS